MTNSLRLSIGALALVLAACAPPPVIRNSPYFPPILGGGAVVAQPGPPMGIPPAVPLHVLKADFLAKAGADTVRFKRDSYALDAEAMAILDRQALWLVANPTVPASIEGHADIRQTREYALGLGERRAAAVRNFLLTQGVRPEQLSTVSWGREQPAVAAAHDAAWLQNSRVVTVLREPDPALLPPPYFPPLPPRN